jgi:hypothetical protein
MCFQDMKGMATMKLTFRGIHGTNDSPSVYARRSRSTRAAVPRGLEPQPLAYRQPNVNNLTFTTSPESLLHDHPEQRTETVAAEVFGDASVESEMQVERANSLTMPPFFGNHTEFGYFEEINYGLDVLNHSNDFNATLDQMMNMSFASDFSVLARRASPPAVSSLGDSETLFRIPTSDDVPIHGIQTGPPPSKHAWRNLNEARWTELVAQVEIVGKVPEYQS